MRHAHRSPHEGSSMPGLEMVPAPTWLREVFPENPDLAELPEVLAQALSKHYGEMVEQSDLTPERHAVSKTSNNFRQYCRRDRFHAMHFATPEELDAETDALLPGEGKTWTGFVRESEEIMREIGMTLAEETPGPFSDEAMGESVTLFPVIVELVKRGYDPKYMGLVLGA